MPRLCYITRPQAVPRQRCSLLPPPLPVIGNVRDIPLGVPQWELYESMAQKYGTHLLRYRGVLSAS